MILGLWLLLNITTIWPNNNINNNFNNSNSSNNKLLYNKVLIMIPLTLMLEAKMIIFLNILDIIKLDQLINTIFKFNKKNIIDL